jgi:tetratricopeptide (TPR) repeat protein
MDQRRAEEVLAIAAAADAGRGRADDTATAALRAAAGDIEAAARTLLTVDPPAALELVAALSGFWQDEGRIEDGRALTRGIIEGTEHHATATPRAMRAAAGARTALSELAFRQGDQAMATSEARRAIELASAARDDPAAAMAWLMLARVAFRDGDAPAIEAAARTALALAGHDHLARRGALHMLAWAAHTAGDHKEARRRFEASLAYRREVGAGELSEAVELGNIAELDFDTGDLPRAAGGLRSVVDTAVTLGNRYLLVNTLPLVAALVAEAGRDAEAAVLFGVGEALQVASGLVPDPGGDQAERRAAVAERLGREMFERHLRTGQELSPEAGTERAVSALLSIVATSGVVR